MLAWQPPRLSSFAQKVLESHLVVFDFVILFCHPNLDHSGQFFLGSHEPTVLIQAFVALIKQSSPHVLVVVVVIVDRHVVALLCVQIVFNKTC